MDPTLWLQVADEMDSEGDRLKRQAQELRIAAAARVNNGIKKPRLSPEGKARISAAAKARHERERRERMRNQNKAKKSA